MRALFHKWLLLFVVLAFGLTFGLSWYLHRKEAEKNALQLLEVNLTDVAGRIKRAEANLQTITEMSAASALAKTRAFALLIQERPAILEDPTALKIIRRKLDVDELHVSDETGKLIASLVNGNYHGKDNYIGYNLAKEELSRVFMKAVSDPAFELVQVPQYNGAEGKMFQYTGVHRPDKPGVVQIGYHPSRLKRALQLADVKNIESETRIGINGKLVISENTQHPADYKRFFKSGEGLCQSAVYGKYLLTATLPWKEVYAKNRTVITVLFAGNLIVFALIFFMTATLLQKVVIKEISAVTDSLDEFSKGNFDKTINVKGSSELHALAESINKTLNILKRDSAPPRAETEDEITDMLKKSLLPANIPENPNYKFSAEIFTAEEFGGNLCDMFKVGSERVALFFADVTEKGISQGLYMIKAKNILKKALLKNSPEKALALVNQELFSNREENIPLKAFFCILNLHSGVLQIFNAGHVDPVVKSKNGNVKMIKGSSTPLLGASPDTVFRPLPLQLNAGDIFYFYSDDLVEVTDTKGEKYGMERLLNLISSSGSNASEIIKSVRQDVTRFSGSSSLKADIALAVLEYTPAALVE